MSGLLDIYKAKYSEENHSRLNMLVKRGQKN